MPALRTCLAVIFCLLACQVAAAAAPKRVLLLHSFGPDFVPWAEYGRTIRAELHRQSPFPLDIVEHSLESARSGDVAVEAPFVEYLDALYSQRPLDLIVPLGASAVSFVQRHRQRLFPAAPVVLAAVEHRRVQHLNLTPNDTVVAVRSDFRASLDAVLRVLPDTKTVAIVLGASPTEAFWRDERGRETKPFESRVEFVWYNDLPLSEMLRQAAALPPHSAIFWLTLNIDAAGAVHEGDAALRELRAVTSAPIFSYQGALFGRGIVGGPMHSVLKASQETAAVGVRLLNGEKPADIKVPPIEFAPPRFDWRELQRWNISESRLPPGSAIDFREPTFWEQHRWQALTIAATVLLQAILIFWLLYEHRRRSAAEVQTRSAMAELARSNRIATAGELSASIAHEVNQPLTGITTRASAALRWLAADKPDLEKARAALAQIVAAGERASDIIKSVRAMFTKEPAKRTGINVNALIRSVVEIVRVEMQNNGVDLRLELNGNLPAIDGDEVQLQQVILNLVLNAIEAMHSVQPRLLRIRTEAGETHTVRVAIEDTGAGIDPASKDRIFRPLFTTKPRGMGMGLSICRSIIESHGGRIWVSPRHDRGSVFQFELPAATASPSSTALHAHSSTG